MMQEIHCLIGLFSQMVVIGNMAFLHYATKCIIHFFLHVFWFFPIKRNRIFLLNELSFKYGDNLKYLNEYIKKNYRDKYEIIFPLVDKQEARKEELRYVKPFSIKYFIYLITSHIIITNAGGVSYVPIRKEQLVINTWHGGGPYKKTGGALFNNKWYTKELRMARKNTRYILSSCEYFSKYEAPGMLFDNKSCIPSGMPRNDIFFNKQLSLRKKVFEICGLDESIKLIIFAPTFRNNLKSFTCAKEHHVSNIDYIELLHTIEKKFGGQWKFAIRLHPKLKNVRIKTPDILNLTDYPDMQELLYAADLVITDYSSLMWDFSFSMKPCFIYADDIDEYEKTRGFYMPSTQWPYPIARNNKELMDKIRTFDLASYQKAVKKHHIDSGNYEQGIACKTVIDLIEKNL